MKSLKTNSYYTCSYLESLSLLEVVWHGYMSASELQEALHNITAVLKEKAIDYLVVDDCLLKSAKATDESWIRAFCMPLLASTHVKKMARIACPTAIHQHIVTGILSAIEQEHQYKFEMKTFNDREDAMEWLFAVEPIKEQMPYRGDCRALSLI